MKHILLSIHTKYVEKILDGSKKYEFRGWRLSNKIKYVYIYSSGLEKKVVAKFEVSQIHENSPKNIWNQFKYDSGVEEEEYKKYVNSFNYAKIYAIEIKNLEIFQPSLSLSEIDENLHPPQKFKYLNEKQIKLLERHLST